jgi:hypothetical protein
VRTTNAESPVRRLGGLRVLRGVGTRRLHADVAEEARTRGFAAPVFAGCAFVERNVTARGATLLSGTAVVKHADARHYKVDRQRLTLTTAPFVQGGKRIIAVNTFQRLE